MPRLFCACCGRPFQRTSMRGPAPLYCSNDCRVQMAVRRRVWARVDVAAPRADAALNQNLNQNRATDVRPRAA